MAATGTQHAVIYCQMANACTSNVS